ncbi:unnamed protein product [Schistosoma spindalis]|nr:unnamed protein product [Schistosoma spindale]
MAICPDQLQLLFERQTQRFKNSQLNVLDNLRTRLLNHPCFGDVTEVDKLISNLHTELETECSTYECADKSLYESLMSSNVSETVIHDAPSDPVMSISETCPVVGSNPTALEAPCTNSSQKVDVLLNDHEIPAVPAHEETEIESSIIMTTVASNRVYHSRTKVPDESTHWSFLVLSNMNYLNDSYAFDEIYKIEKNLSSASNDDQEPNKILIDADYSSDRLSTDELLQKSDDNVPEESNFDDFISSDVDPHHLINFRKFSAQCDKYYLNKVKLMVAWVYEDPTLFRGGG